MPWRGVLSYMYSWAVRDTSVAPPKWIATASVEALDLSTMRWSGAGCMPALSDPRASHSVSVSTDGSVVAVCGSYNLGAADRTARWRWSPEGGEWASLPDLPEERQCPACVSLRDGRTLVIGGFVDDMDVYEDHGIHMMEGQPVASVLALAAGGSEWSGLAPMGQARWSAVVVVLPDGKVLVAGGLSALGQLCDTALKSAELYDPATNAWTALPDMAHERSAFTACLLPSGRVAVMGGEGADGQGRKECEAFDPVKRTWEALPEMAVAIRGPGAAPVAGGMVVAGRLTVELFDEENGQWLTLPHPMARLRDITRLVSLPASALLQAS